MMYTILHGTSIRIDADGTLVLPCLAGRRWRHCWRIRRWRRRSGSAPSSSRSSPSPRFHRAGFTHGDAMAENVMVDLEAGVAHWFDFETVHDPNRPMAWRRADDVRALLTTCLLRTDSSAFAATLRLILDVYGNDEVVALLATSSNGVFQRPLPFYLGQAALSFQCYEEIARLLTQRDGEAPQPFRNLPL